MKRPHSRARGARSHRGRAAGLGLGLFAVALTGCGAAPGSGLSAPPSARLPALLPTAVPGPTDWAVVAMGTTGRNRFWELFAAQSGASWSLVTPPGVATNGGLVIAAGAGSAGSGSATLVGVRGSQALTFSVLAGSTSAGRTWAPGYLGGALIEGPDALAAGPDGRWAAVITGGGGAVLESTGQLAHAELAALAGDPAPGPLGDWHVALGPGALAGAARAASCHPGPPSGATFTSRGALVVSAPCRTRGLAGVFTDGPLGWQLTPPPVPASWRGVRVDVARVQATGRGTFALLAARRGGRLELSAGWRPGAGGAWQVGRPLVIPAGSTVLAAGSTGTGAYVLLGGAPRSRQGPALETLTGPDSRWRRTGDLPLGAQTVLVTGRSLDVLSAAGSTFTAWVPGPHGQGWVRRQTLHIAIPYGSSG